MEKEYLNLILLSFTIIVMLCICVVYVMYKTLGCRGSCWLHGITIKYLNNKGNNLSNSSSNNLCSGCNAGDKVRGGGDNKNTDVSIFEDDDVIISNADIMCCIHFSWMRNRDTDVITLPGAQKIQYGRTLLPQLSFCKRLFMKCSSFPLQGKNETCPICLDSFVDGCSLILLKCCHGYHEQCLASWLQSASKSKVSCPMCKKDMYADGFQEKIPLTISTFSHTTSSSYTSYLGYSRMIVTHV